MDEYSFYSVIIEEELDEGREIALFPMGKGGLLARILLENKYGKRGVYIDNNACKYNQDIVSLDDYIKIDNEQISIILCFNKNSNQWKDVLLEMGIQAKIILLDSYPIRYYNVFDKEYFEIKKMCSVMSVRCFNLIRIGNDCDGGYVLLDDLDRIDGVYSFGIGKDVSFEEDIASRGVDVFCYDPTINEFPSHNNHLHYSCVGIDRKDEGNMMTMESIIEKNGHGDYNNLLLKMDVEGFEWDFIEQANSSTLKRFRQMTFEFHELDKACCKRIIKCLKKLNQTHQAIWIHGNNSGGVAISKSTLVPRLLEISYVRKNDYRFDDVHYDCPTNLDFPNLEIRNEIMLPGWGTLDVR